MASEAAKRIAIKLLLKSGWKEGCTVEDAIDAELRAEREAADVMAKLLQGTRQCFMGDPTKRYERSRIEMALAAYEKAKGE